jgi:hypothetical protein
MQHWKMSQSKTMAILYITMNALKEREKGECIISIPKVYLSIYQLNVAILLTFRRIRTLRIGDRWRQGQRSHRHWSTVWIPNKLLM